MQGMISRSWQRLVVFMFRLTPRFLSKWIVYIVKPKYVIAVVALVADDAGRLLVLHHTYGKKYRWRFPGGIMERHERPFETAERELREEANMVVKAKQLITIVDGYATLDIAVYCELVNELPFVPNAEVDDLRWIHPDERELSLPTEQMEIWNVLKEMNP